MASTQRRLASVLFADLVAFTTLAEQLDLEEVALLQDRYFDRVRRMVEAEGGAVEKFIGDAVVATFRAACAHDDAAAHLESAVRMNDALGARTAAAQRLLDDT